MANQQEIQSTTLNGSEDSVPIIVIATNNQTLPTNQDIVDPIHVANNDNPDGDHAQVEVADGANANVNKDNPENLAVINEPQIIVTNLEAYLKKTSIGKEVLKCYKKCLEEKHPLPRNIRSKLVRLIIKREKDWALKDITEDQSLHKFVITAERFDILANEIASIFKYEKAATYYTPFQQVGKKSILASGKLWHHYNYTKECLKEASHLDNHRTEEINEAVISELEDEQYIYIDEIEWLSSHIEPWTDVVQGWKDTYVSRRVLFFTQQGYNCLGLY